MNRRVVYIMSGAAHTPYLLASLYTLRQHYSGLIVIAAWPESFEIVQRISKDFDGVAVMAHEPAYRGKNDQFLDKIDVARCLVSTDVLLYLDADTTIHKPVDYLFEMAEVTGFCATQWNQWTTFTHCITKRLEDLRAYPPIDTTLIDQCIKYWQPSVNGGVWAARPGSPVLPLWYDWTMAATQPRSTFIADEKVLHLMVAKFWDKGQLYVATGGAFNCSPIYQPANLRDDEVVIRHYHGDSNVRPQDKSEKGYRLWWPIFARCMADNIGGVKEWLPKCGNKWLKRLGVI